MIDIHCHILYALDDGSDSLETSLQMAEMAIADGITHVIGTPHANSQYPFVPELIQGRRDEIQARLGQRLILATGCDFHLSFENLQDIREEPSKYTLNHKKYLLVEFADYAIPPSIDQTLHHLALAGVRPIITHPERNPLIRSQPDHLVRWLRQGCYVQVTAGSLLGRFGPGAKQMVEALLELNAIHFVASDAHNLTSRPLKLKEAFDLVAQHKNLPTASALFTDNPLAAFEGRALPYTPDPPDSIPSAHPGKHAGSGVRRKRFWFF